MDLEVDGRGGSHHATATTDEIMTNSRELYGSNNLCNLAQKTCEAMERGDTSELYSILDLSAEGDSGASRATLGADNTEASSNNHKCREILAVFYSLVGHNDKYDVGELEIPLSVKAHLLLRALLQLRHDKYSIPWEAATAAIQSLQYSKKNNQSGNSSTLSHGEELAMIAEIRSFVTNLSTEKIMGSIIMSRTIIKLTELASTILEPLQMNNTKSDESLKDEESSDLHADRVRSLRRCRRKSYALPLELIPAIFATLDSLGDMQIPFLIENNKYTSMKVEDEDSIDIDISPTLEGHKSEQEREIYIRASDKLLSSMFASYIGDGSCDDSVNNLHRTIRADAALPLLSLAMNDIGFSRMSTTLPDDEDVTCWDCLKFALKDVILSNLVCYSDDHGSMDELAGEAKQQIIDEALSDEGIHIIPLSDYPALMRCIFRMVATGSLFNTLSGSSWESLLLHLYHAAAVATIKPSLPSVHRRKMPGGVDRLATLSTVESHVLLPSCTGASVSTINSILEACNNECCPSCKSDAVEWGICSHNDRDVVPAWAVAGVVLLIMRARSSNLSQSASSTSFGPRAVFRMASEMLRKSAQESNSGFGGDDEVGLALKVLLHLSGVREGTCRTCCDRRLNEDAENSSYDVLKYSYYAGNDTFLHRCVGSDNDRNSYRHELGLQTLSSYSMLIRASLNHGANVAKIRSIDSFTADTARTWIDAANMLLDESYCSPSNGKSSPSIPDGTAMAIVIIVVIFFEVPSSQDGIVRSIYDRLANMTSHNSQSIGKQGEESCFVLISTLAWSLVSSDGKCPASNVVRRKGGNDTSVLGPLCNLLSKTALSRDQHLNGSLSYWALRQLARALVPVPSGREVILAMAQKNGLSTSSPYTHSLSKHVPFFESLPSIPSASNDAIYLAVDCLCMLIEKCHPSDNSSADDCGRRALGMLTDIIVLQRPSLSSGSHTTSRIPISVVSWTFGEIHKSTRLGRLPKWAIKRLMRACYIGLLKFITLEESESVEYSSHLIPENIFSVSYSSSASNHQSSSEKTKRPTSLARSFTFRARYDFPGMLRLVVSLYDKSGSTSQAFPEPHALLKSHLLRTLLSHSDKPFESTSEDASTQHAIHQLFKEGRDALQRGFNPTDESISFAIDAITLMVLVQGATGMIRKEQRVIPGRVDADALKNLNDYICRAERYYYLQEGNRSQQPSWIKVECSPIGASNIHRESIMKLDESLLNCVDFKLFHLSLCDILLEILLNRTHKGAIEIVDRNQEPSILRGVSYVLECKRHNNAGELLLADMSHHSICRLFELSSQHLRPLLGTSEKKEKDVLAEVDVLVKNVIDLCKISQSIKSSQLRILSSFWSVYCSLADEESSQLFLSLVKEAYVKMRVWADPGKVSDAGTFSLLSIASSEDLDYHVRYLRRTILEALSEVLTISQNESDFQERKNTLCLLLQILPQLCQDLDGSFQGYSGSIDKPLFLSFLDATDKCIDAIAALFESIPPSAQYQIRSSFKSVHQAAEIIWGVFCDNSLRQASVIKGTLRLCIDKMPNLIRRVERVSNECIVDSPPSAHASELLNQCSNHLMSEPIKKEAQQEAKRSEIATVSDENDNNIEARRSDGTKVSASVLMKEKEGLEDEVLIPKKENPDFTKERSKALENEAVRSHMPNITSIAWIYNCAFVAVTNNWNDSYRIIAGDAKLNRIRVKSPAANPTALRRIEEFSRLHTSLCRLFEVKARPAGEIPGDVNAGPGESSKILAQMLSYHGKSNMCSCVEKIAMTLLVSIKQVVKHFKADQQTPTNEIKLNESVVCILGWLHTVNAKATKHNLITGPLQWSINEKMNFSRSTFKRSDNDNYPILGRLPKVLLRLEALEADLRRLDAIFADFGNARSFRESMSTLNQLASVLLKEKGLPEEHEGFRKMLRQCIEVVDSCKNAMEITDVDGDLFEDESDADLEGDGFTMAGKRKKQRYAPIRKSQRMALRSRNETIDNWLTIDDDELGSAPGEKYNVDDSFVDLEDFIVEG